MKRKRIFQPLKILFALTAAMLLTVGCANDNIHEQERDTKRLTEFVVEDNVDNNTKSTRTTGSYSGAGIDFYWTVGDQLWLYNDARPRNKWIKDTHNDIKARINKTGTGATKIAKASFFFDGIYTADSCKLRYTGKPGIDPDKITIKSEQKQTIPNDATHIGQDGDCGTATAKKKGNHYVFSLDHQASYITFLPFSTQNELQEAVITEIKVSAEKAIAGTFSFGDKGIDLSSRPEFGEGSETITLKLNETVYLPEQFITDDYKITSTPMPSKNAAIMVIAPGTYSTFTIEYRLFSKITKCQGTITKIYNNVTFIPGKNKKVSANLQVPVYNFEYSMWDAEDGQHYWKDHESSRPLVNGAKSEDYAKTLSDTRWYNQSVVFPGTAVRSSVNCPNANEISWYIVKGALFYDESLWATDGHLYAGGIWLKKLSVIATEQHTDITNFQSKAPDGNDFRTTQSPNTGEIPIFWKKISDTKRPAHLSDYFYLPFSGRYQNGKRLDCGSSGFYWSSTVGRPRGAEPAACFLEIDESNLYLKRSNNEQGFRQWSK